MIPSAFSGTKNCEAVVKSNSMFYHSKYMLAVVYNEGCASDF